MTRLFRLLDSSPALPQKRIHILEHKCIRRSGAGFVRERKMAADGSGNIRELKNFIGGEFVASGNTFENTTPIDGTLLSHVHEATKEMVDNAVIAAQKAAKIWSKMPVEARCKILYAVATASMPALTIYRS